MPAPLDKWNSIKELFGAALELDPALRIAFLRERCSETDICSEVERLLHEHDEAGAFLSTPILESVTIASNTLTPLPRLETGELIAARFRIFHFVAAGGMGEVYAAEDTQLERTVALKFVSPESAREQLSLTRFQQEAKAASALNHPNICTVYDVGQDRGRAFIAMEFLEGETLATRLKRGPCPLDEGLRIALSISSALVAAHHKGIIHRDIKPGNIMLTGTGAKLLDFGLALHRKLVTKEPQTTATVTGDANVTGTLPYMSPEQLRGQETDYRSDIFSFGAVLYEMFTGRGAFKGLSTIDTIAAITSGEPAPIREQAKNLPNGLETLIRRCLRKKPEERYASTSEIEHALQECLAAVSEPASGINFKVLVSHGKRPKIIVSSALVLALLSSFPAWWIFHISRVRWAREQALPQIEQLIEEEKFDKAYSLAVHAERYIPDDLMLAKYWPAISWSGSINTTPPGVSVFRKDYNAPDSGWEFIGRTPVEKRRFPLVDSQWKFELKGFTTVERATFPDDSMAVKMEEEGKSPPGMVRVESRTSASQQSEPITLWGIAGFEDLPSVALSDYWIDKFEVTNQAFKRFVDQGGYQKEAYWKQEFRDKDGKPIAWAEAMKLLVDKTGRPGPATWMQGEYPRGQENYPVAGVSWFEAAAYAAFAGESLPTIYHWTAAASTQHGSRIIPASNFGSAGVAPVGKYRGMSSAGALDMAGNVKEWIWNEASSGKRYIMGGAWNEPTYMFNDADARPPFERSPNFGFRCAKYVLSHEAAKAADPVTVHIRDYSSEKPVSDQLFQAYRSLYSYDKTPLHPVVESTQQTEDWKLEKITFDAAYGGERIIAYLFLPRKASPPFQTVVYFPGAGAAHIRSSADALPFLLGDFDFIIKSGRAVMFPEYLGTFERGAGPKTIYWPNTSSSYRDHVIAWSKDLGRSIDYLETRPDIDRMKFAYEGYSWGAAMGALLPAVENRLQALVLICPGFYLQNRLPEVDQLNFAPRVKAPVLMLNGRFDFIWPPGTSQEPMYRLLGTPKEHKRRVVYDTGHDIPRIEEIKETLNWLDRYLGRVKSK